MKTGQTQATFKGSAYMNNEGDPPLFFSPDGTMLAFVDDPRGVQDPTTNVMLWNWVSDKAVRLKSEAITDMRFIDNGATLIMSTASSQILRYDTKTGALRGRRTIARSGAEVLQATFSEDGSWLVSSDAAGQMRITNLITGKQHIGPAAGSSFTIRIFTPDNSLLLEIFGSTRIKMWDTRTGQVLKETLIEEKFPFKTIVFKENRARLIASHYHGVEFHQFDIPQRPAAARDTTAVSLRSESAVDRGYDAFYSRFRLPSVKGEIQAAEISTSGKWLVCGAARTAYLYDLEKRKLRHRLRLGDTALHVVFSRNERLLLTESRNRTLQLWDVRSGEELRSWNIATAHSIESSTAKNAFPDPRGPYSMSPAISPDGTLIAAIPDPPQGDISLLWPANAPRGDYLSHAFFNANGAGIKTNAVTFASDGKTLVDARGSMLRWSLIKRAGDGSPSVEAISRRGFMPPRVQTLFFSPGGSSIVGINDTGQLGLFPSGSRTSRQLQQDNKADRYQAAAVAPDDSVLAAATRPQAGNTQTRVKLWNTSTGAIKQVLILPRTSVQALGFSADGSRLWAVSGDGSLYVWKQFPGASKSR
jgi:WD40 repeat protein